MDRDSSTFETRRLNREPAYNNLLRPQTAWFFFFLTWILALTKLKIFSFYFLIFYFPIFPRSIFSFSNFSILVFLFSPPVLFSHFSIPTLFPFSTPIFCSLFPFRPPFSAPTFLLLSFPGFSFAPPSFYICFISIVITFSFSIFHCSQLSFPLTANSLLFRLLWCPYFVPLRIFLFLPSVLV